MALQFSTTYRNAMLDQFETVVGTGPVLKIYTGTAPANCGTAASGTVLVSMTLPSDWMADASGGSKSKSGTWSITATGTGTAGYFRIYDSTSTTCHAQGNCGISGGGYDLELDNTSIAVNQTVSISTFTRTAPGS